jgi:hypothetical protein
MEDLTTELDYSNTIIYKISCKDSAVTDLYVGHTINFVQRQTAHKYSCISDKSPNYNCKLYQIIRQHGGWNNWSMNIVNFFNCTNKTEAREKEQYYYTLLNANLNSIEPLPIKFKSKLTNKLQINNENEEIIKKKKHKFVCSICKYSTSRKSQYERHLATPKHKEKTTNVVNISQPQGKEYKCVCGKIYKYDSGYYRHKKQCVKQNIHYDNHNNIVSMYNEMSQMMCKILENIKQLHLVHSNETVKNDSF